MARHDVKGVLKAADEQCLRQSSSDLLRVGASCPIDVSQQPGHLGFFGCDLPQQVATPFCSRRGHGQKRTASRARTLETAHAAQRVVCIRREHGLQPVPKERFHRALIGRGVRLDSVSHDTEHFDGPFWRLLAALLHRQQGAHALVKGRVRRHHLFERRQPAGQAVALAFQDPRGLGQPAGALGKRRVAVAAI